MFSWTDHFFKIKNSANDTKVLKCCVCGDLLYCSDVMSASNFGWNRLENTDLHICYTCSSGAYVTKKEVSRLDRLNRKIFGKALNKDTRRLYRNCYTWKEHKKYNKEYKTALRFFLFTNDIICYNKYLDLLSD